MIADQPQMALIVKELAIKCDNATTLLPTVLQGVEAQGGDDRGLAIARYAKHPAFFAQAVLMWVKPNGYIAVWTVVIRETALGWQRRATVWMHHHGRVS
jgi:hypothetical protein